MNTLVWVIWNVWYWGTIALILAVPAAWFIIQAYVVLRLFVAFFRVANRKQGS